MKAFAMVRLSFPTIKCHAKKKKIIRWFQRCKTK